MNHFKTQLMSGKRALLIHSFQNFDTTLRAVKDELEEGYISSMAAYMFDEVNKYAAIDSQGVNGFSRDIRLKSVLLFLLNQKAKHSFYKGRSVVDLNAGWLTAMDVTTLAVCEFLQTTGHSDLIELVCETYPLENHF